MNVKDLVHRLNHLIEGDSDIPYFTAKEVQSLLAHYGILAPVRYTVWEWDGIATVVPTESTEEDLRVTSDESPVVYKGRTMFRTFSAASTVATIYTLYRYKTLEDAEREFGSALRSDGFLEWWAKAYLILEFKRSLFEKHFGVFS